MHVCVCEREREREKERDGDGEVVLLSSLTPPLSILAASPPLPPPPPLLCSCPQIETNLALRSPSSPGLILQALEAIVRLNKGFKSELCTRSRPHIGGRWLEGTVGCAPALALRR